MRGRPFALVLLGACVACGFADDGERVTVQIDPNVAEESAGAYVTEWQVQADEEIVLPLPEGYSYQFHVDWGDGNEAQVRAHDDPAARHVYAEAGTYAVMITGKLPAWSFWRVSDSRDSLLLVHDLGDVGWQSLFGAFAGCSYLTTVAGGNVANVIDMGSMFNDAVQALPEGQAWDTAKVTDMSYMFAGALLAQPQVGDWQTGAVQDMSRMFAEAAAADPDVSKWDTASVLRMAGMFYEATVAAPATGHWNTSSVTDMSDMFVNAVHADPDVSCWNTSKVTDMSNMFYGALKANPDVSCWDVARVTNMKNMFREARAAVPDMSAWEIPGVATMEGMFSGVSLPAKHWSDLLIRAASTSKQQGVTLDGGESHWQVAAETARATLVARGWKITDLGKDAD